MQTYVAEIGEIVRAQRRDEEVIEELSERLSKVVKELVDQRTWIRWFPYFDTIASSVYYTSTVVAGNQTLGEEYVRLFESEGLNRIVPSLPARFTFVLLHSILPIVSSYCIQKAEKHLHHPSTKNFLGIDVSRNRKARSSFIKLVHWIRTWFLPNLNRIHVAVFYITGAYYSIARRTTGIRFLSANPQTDIPALKVYRFLGYVTVLQLIVTVSIAAYTFSKESAANKKATSATSSSPTVSDELPHSWFSCPICLEKKNPSALLCGHIYCWQCILEHAVAKSSSSSTAKCPQCRLEFEARDKYLHRALSSLPTNVPPAYMTGIQPTGIPHLGNYFGAIQPWVRLQKTLPESTAMFLAVVDQHAISLGPKPPRELSHNTREMAASLVACGVDASRTLLFRQSDVPEIAQLCWILSSLQTVTKLQRLPQYKDKAKSFKKGDVPVGLMTYPVLQAADVLIFKATHVPVGEDQSQHMNLLTDLAYSFNKSYDTEIFPLPQQVTGAVHARIRSLRDPKQKMSKSAPSSRSRIELIDDRATIFEKIRKAMSDNEGIISYDHEQRPGVSNLIDLYCAFSKKSPGGVVEEKWSVVDLKENLSELIDEALSPIRSRYKELSKTNEIDRILHDNGLKAREIAEANMKEIRRIVGFS